MKLESLVGPFQARLRSYGFGEELDQGAKALFALLAGHRTRRANVDDRLRLKALALLAEYLDAVGRAQEGAALLRLTAEELFEDAAGWPRELATAADRDAARRLLRQRVWCCMAYALCHLRANRLTEAGRFIESMREFVVNHLAQPDFPCHGTLALVRYYQGLWRRNAGKLNEASWDFDAALEHVRLRLEEKQAKYERVDVDRYRRELIYSRVSTARILGFGHGGIALSRGRYVEARSWMAAAQQILSQLGQETWRRGLEVYGRSATILIQDLEPGSIAALEENARRLGELAVWFKTRNRRNAFIAGAFAILAEYRLQQIRRDGKDLKKRIVACMREAYLDSGPLSATAALRLIECLLREGDFARCEQELERFEGTSGDEDLQVLRAELWLETERVEQARGLLTQLVELRPANRAFRARAWALLALCEQRSGQRLWAERALAAAKESLEHVQDGYTKVLVANIAAHLESAAPLPLPMPYQSADDDPRSWDLDHNLEMARLNVVEAVYRRNPGQSIERLAAIMGRGDSWLYGFLARNKDVDWIQHLLSAKRYPDGK